MHQQGRGQLELKFARVAQPGLCVFTSTWRTCTSHLDANVIKRQSSHPNAPYTYGGTKPKGIARLKRKRHVVEIRIRHRIHPSHEVSTLLHSRARLLPRFRGGILAGEGEKGNGEGGWGYACEDPASPHALNVQAMLEKPVYLFPLSSPAPSDSDMTTLSMYTHGANICDMMLTQMPNQHIHRFASALLKTVEVVASCSRGMPSVRTHRSFAISIQRSLMNPNNAPSIEGYYNAVKSTTRKPLTRLPRDTGTDCHGTLIPSVKMAEMHFRAVDPTVDTVHSLQGQPKEEWECWPRIGTVPTRWRNSRKVCKNSEKKNGGSVLLSEPLRHSGATAE
ncbi:hypothetical protein B0H13DRAFT_2262509 [Mycena leptocephala]|nr:hypothetical protein B0H13DRAFT_2262509 [Mycena leptocephala]